MNYNDVSKKSNSPCLLVISPDSYRTMATMSHGFSLPTLLLDGKFTLYILASNIFWLPNLLHIFRFPVFYYLSFWFPVESLKTGVPSQTPISIIYLKQ